MYKIINKKKRIVTIVADTIGKIVTFPLRLFRKQSPIHPEQTKTICVIRTAYIGDVVMTLPLLPALKQIFPDAHISVLTSTAAAPLLFNNPYVDKILPYDPFWFYQTSLKTWLSFIKRLRHHHFDLVIESRADIREIAMIVYWMKARHTVSYDVGGGGYLLTDVVPYPGLTHKVDYHLNIARFLGGGKNSKKGTIYPTPAEHDTVTALLAQKGVQAPYIAIHPGSRVKLKCWFHDRFSKLCDMLSANYDMNIVLLGSREEQSLLDSIQTLAQQDLVIICGEMNIRELAVTLEGASVFVCNDSAPMHIAAAMNTPTVAIFGPSKSKETAPYDVRCEIVEKYFPCRHDCDENTCHNLVEYHGCLEQITVSDVLKAVDTLLRE